MENPICVSTGCVYKLSNDRNVLIEKLSKLPLAGVELSFAHPDYLLNFNINQNNLEYLNSLKFNSIHTPWMDIKYGKNKASKQVLQKISELCKQVNARNVVFHNGQIENYDSILNNDFVASLENDDWKNPKYNAEGLKSVFGKNTEFKFTFDFAHAHSISPLEIRQCIKYFKDRLIEIHLSIMDKSLERHDFLHKHNNKETRELLQSLKKLSTPVVLEAVVSDSRKIEEIGQEIEYIKRI